MRLGILAAAVVGIHLDAIAMFVSHKAKFDSGSVIHHVVATDGQRIYALQTASLILLC